MDCTQAEGSESYLVGPYFRTLNLCRIFAQSPNKLVPSNNIVAGSGVVPSTTKLSMRLFPSSLDAPLNMIRKVAFGLLFSAVMLLKLKVKSWKEVAGT